MPRGRALQGPQKQGGEGVLGSAERMRDQVAVRGLYLEGNGDALKSFKRDQRGQMSVLREWFPPPGPPDQQVSVTWVPAKFLPPWPHLLDLNPGGRALQEGIA